MACTAEQSASNARNSQKSTGPRSPEGRAKVARNSFKHGLTGAGIVVPDEDVGVIEERFEQFNVAVNPLGVISEFLIRHLVLASIKMDRGARHEAATVTRNMLLAEEAEADAHRDALQARVDRIDAEPEVAFRELQRSPRGIAWMISSWEDLKADLLASTPHSYHWHSGRIQRAESLIGSRHASPQLSRIGVLSDAYRGHFEGIDDWPDLPRDGRQEAARAEIVGIMDAEIARLKDVLANLDRDRLALIEAGAKARALFDPSKEAVLARKYAAAAQREFFKILKTIQELNAAAMADAYAEAESGEPAEVEDVNPEMIRESADLALNFRDARPIAAPARKRPPAPADRPKSKGRRSNRDPRRRKA